MGEIKANASVDFKTVDIDGISAVSNIVVKASGMNTVRICTTVVGTCSMKIYEGYFTINTGTFANECNMYLVDGDVVVIKKGNGCYKEGESQKWPLHNCGCS